MDLIITIYEHIYKIDIKKVYYLERTPSLRVLEESYAEIVILDQSLKFFAKG